MGRYGEVLGIGPSRRELVPFLQQPGAWHERTREGTVIVVPVFTALKDAGFQFYFRMEPSRLE
ncbi:hypothetical protein HMI49_06485 [Corallococcus exercitus]|uniref:Uncharacterized protein n=1 Tax=Corallococcus exercitus TaxID=2316736 RepID=A0A7Y4NRE0_9BACT|nr:hypothetical protein [Corallococcus exercitus]NOK32842.1 hypothetical protein [Corallococcus exercitus]